MSDRLADRKNLLASFDRFRRDVDASGQMKGMDALTEREVLDNIRSFMRGRVLIVITHRDGVAATFDRVLRVTKGRVEESVPAG